MFKIGMYVRCPIDIEDQNEPRDYISGRIMEINEFSEIASIEFFDLLGLNSYYKLPNVLEFPLTKIQRCKIGVNSLVEYKGAKYHILQCVTDKSDDFRYYYLISDTGVLINACEKDIKASLNSGEISPLSQLKQFEFQGPVWYFGRSAVTKTIYSIENAFYGFKELAGCKIFLKPYQLKTVMRCLAGENCRYMIADEVGLGKTIEALSVLKIYLSDKKNKRILICVPDALVEQWKTELAFKFRLFSGRNINGNNIRIIPTSKIIQIDEKYDFMIVDEVHNILNMPQHYKAVLKLSCIADNVIMLSATPVQSRNEEYHKLLSLIQPERYYGMDEDEFISLLELQNKVVRKVYSAVSSFEDYKETIKDSNDEHNEDTYEAFEELVEILEEIFEKTHDTTIKDEIKNLNYEADDFSLMRLEQIVSYICEAYQLERCIIRNRKKIEDTNNRLLKEIPYDMDVDFNNTEFRIYSLLSEWLSKNNFEKSDFDGRILPLINAFFSSSLAFSEEIKKNSFIPTEIRELTEKWISEDFNTIKNIRNILDDPMDSFSRMVSVCDYLEQEAYDKKVLIFTHFKGTHQLYRMLLTKVFGEDCCTFFCKGMSADELELNTYRFQNEPKYRIMLSDESGGEGRNFQKADEMICIDLPWSANTLEQRIGRLDRIGRDKSKDVVSVIVYAQDTVEKDLFDIWNKGLNIFNKSQSGLEIIMNDIDEHIKSVVMNNFKYGLSSIVEDMIDEIKKTEKRVKEERHFDIAAYTYQHINREIEKTVRQYNNSESELFRNAMMSWSFIVGFNGNFVSESTVRFTASSFSPNSAKKALFVPPDMEKIIKDKLNQMQNHIRMLNGDRTIQNDSNLIQGTFDRNMGLENDYLHFFAPGDGIFDSIVNNSVSAYKGKCSAFALEGAVNWEGFIFNWYIKPNELLLLENGISLQRINQYRAFLSSEIISSYVQIGDYNDGASPLLNDDDLQKFKIEFKNFEKIPILEQKYFYANYGKRKPSNDFLKIKDKYAISNLSWFKAKYPSSIWKEIVSICYKKGKTKAEDEFKKRGKIKALKETLNQEYCLESVASEYFGKQVDLEEKQRTNNIIFKSFSKPNLVLDSVCYVRMIKK